MYCRGGIIMNKDYNDVIPELHYFMCRYCTRDWIMRETVTDYVDLTYIFEGKVTYYINGKAYKAEKGDLLCIPQGSRRAARIDVDNPMACYAANLTLCDLQGNPVELPFPILSKVGIHDELLELYNRLNGEWLIKKRGYPIQVRALMLELVYWYLKVLYYKEPFDDIDPRMQRVISYIYDNYSQKITIDDLAGLVGLNSSYMGTLFKNSTGCCVKDFINRVRINNAENLIIGGNSTMREAAAKSGFDDIFYFSKVFKKIKGYPPSQIVISTFR